MNILEALDDPNLFAPHFTGESWNGWKGFLAALFALPAPDGTAEAYGACTGRSVAPDKPFTEAALIVGRRGGKSRILALIAVYLATFRDYAPYLAAGELATIAVLAANRSQARSIFRFVSGLLKGVPLFARMILDENTEAITLSNRVVIEIGTASFRTNSWILLRGGAVRRNCILAAGRDVGKSRCRDSARFAAGHGEHTRLRPSDGLQPIRQAWRALCGLSPAFRQGRCARVGLEGRHGDDESEIDPAIIAEAYDSDPEAARAEYGAEFRDDLPIS